MKSTGRNESTELFVNGSKLVVAVLVGDFVVVSFCLLVLGVFWLWGFIVWFGFGFFWGFLCLLFGL